MTRLTPSDQAGTGSAPGSATIPPQRSPRSLRLLVLGTGDSAASLRARAADAGAELAQRFSSRVTHVVADETVGDDDSRVARARTAGLPVLSLEQAEELFMARDEAEVGDGMEAEVGVGVGVEAGVEVEALRHGTVGVGVRDVAAEEETAAGMEAAEQVAVEDSAGEPGLVDVAVGMGVGVGEREVVEERTADGTDEAESIGLVRPRSEFVAPREDGPTNVFGGSALEAVLLFPPLPADESVETCGCGEICGGEGGEGGGGGGRVGVEDGVGDGVGVGAGVGDGVGDGIGVAVGDGVEDGVGVGVGVGGEGGGGVAAEVIGMRLSAEREEDFGAGVDVAGVMAGDVMLGPDTRVSDPDPDPGAAESAQTPVAAAGSVAWALVPLASLGLLTPIAMGYAAYRMRSRPLAYATAWYTIAVTAAFTVSAAAPRGGATHSAVSDLLTACLATSWLGGTVHSFLIRRRVFG